MLGHRETDRGVAAGRGLGNQLVEVCPVRISGQASDGSARGVEENEDECVLCDLCVQAAPAGKVRVIKLYE